MTDAERYLLAAGAAVLGGLVNAIAGGGSLITFPALVAGGLSNVAASVTNTVALCPGYLGATLAQRRDLAGQGKRAATILTFGALGGVAGALLLLWTGEAAFKLIVPYLILAAALLLATQDRLRRWLLGRTKQAHAEAWGALPVGLAAIYGGYFGAGMGVMILAALAVILDDTLIRINALKQSVSLVVNVTAALVFVFSGDVDWPIAGTMLAASLVGGAIGGAIASRIPVAVLRWTVVTLATVVAAIYLWK